jgi:hypothetical protein
MTINIEFKKFTTKANKAQKEGENKKKYVFIHFFAFFAFVVDFSSLFVITHINVFSVYNLLVPPISPPTVLQFKGPARKVIVIAHHAHGVSAPVYRRVLKGLPDFFSRSAIKESGVFMPMITGFPSERLFFTSGRHNVFDTYV